MRGPQSVLPASMMLMLLASVPAWAALTQAQEDEIRSEAANFKYNTVKTKEGLYYRVPEDMPIEMRGGIQAPIPFDEYMYSKFKQMDTRLAGMDRRLDHIEKLLEELRPKKAGSDKLQHAENKRLTS